MKYISFDTETTGLNPKENRIIELAAEVYDEKFNIIDQMDMFIKLPDGEHLPELIVNLTGITDEILLSEGVDEEVAAERFAEMLTGDSKILVAHNANFDLGFVSSMFARTDQMVDRLNLLWDADYIDTLTISKDRKTYSHKLSDMIEHYDLAASNTHRAIDDAHAVTELLKAFKEERNDISSYINIFGYNPKYGTGMKNYKVEYMEQPYRKEDEEDLVSSDATLPMQWKALKEKENVKEPIAAPKNKKKLAKEEEYEI